jgi:hypothetical protein
VTSGADPSFAQLPITIRQSRRKAGLLAFLAAIFVGMGTCTYGLGDLTSRIISIFCVVFFGLCLIVASIQLICPGRLVIDCRGVTQTFLRRSHAYPWPEVANFRVWRVAHNELVAYDDLRTPNPHPTLQAINRSIGADAALAGGWAMPAGRLADLLNAARDHCLAPTGPQRERPRQPPEPASATGST